MTTVTPPTLSTQAEGLVVMLDAAGRTIAGLEARVEHLEDQLAESRQQVTDLTELLAQARGAVGVPPDTGTPAENDPHAHRHAATA